MNARGERRAPWLVLAGALIAFGADFIFRGKVFLPADILPYWPPWNAAGAPRPAPNNVVISDVVDSLYPMLHYLSERLGAGDFPLWNPHVFLGLPHSMIAGANLAFDPILVLLLWAFSPETAHGLILLIHLSAIAAFSFLFFRLRGAAPAAAVAGAVVLTFNGHLMVWLELLTADAVFAGLATSLYLYERSLRSRALWPIWLNALVLGRMLMSGAVHWLFFLLPLLLLYALIRTSEIWESGEPLRRRLRPLALCAGPLGVAALLALPNLLSFRSFLAHSQRGRLGFEWLAHNSATFYPESFATFVFPSFLGYHPGGEYFARDYPRVVYQNFNELCVYVGVATLPLAAFAFRCREARRLAATCGVVIAGALLVAMRPLWLHELLYRFVPGFRMMQPVRALMLLPLPFAMLAALGLDSLLERPLSRRACGMIGAGVCASAAAAAAALQAAHGYFVRWPRSIHGISLADHFRLSNPNLLVALLFVVALGMVFVLYACRRIGARGLATAIVALLLVDLVPFGIRVNTRVDRAQVFPWTEGLRFLAADREPHRILPVGFVYDTFMTYRLETLGGYASLYPRRAFDLISAAEERASPQRHRGSFLNILEPTAIDSPLLPLLNVKYVVVPRTAPLAAEALAGYEPVHASDVLVYRANRYLPRAFAVFEARQVSGDKEAIRAMLEPGFDPGKVAVVEKEPPALEGPPERQDPPELARPSADEIVIRTGYGRPALVVVSEQFFPGWEAEIDERPAEVLVVDAALMGVHVPAGAHRVSMRFSPRPLRLGFSVTALVGLLGTALATADALRRRSRRTSRA